MSTPALSGRGAIRRPRPEPRTLDEPGPEPRPKPLAGVRRWLVTTALTTLVVLFAARGIRIAATDSITSDESTHLVHSLHWWMTGDDLGMWELGAPRLPHLLNALPSYLTLRHSGRLPEAGSGRVEALCRLVLSGSARVLVPARLVAIAWGVVLLLAVFWVVARARGGVAGLVAAGLVALVPEVVAHASIAGSDLPFTAAAFVALGLIVRYAERPSAGRWAAVAAAVGLAWAMRHTALLLIPLAAGVHLGCGLRRPRPDGLMPVLERLLGSALACLGLVAIAFGMLWAADGFETISVAGVSEKATSLKVPRRLGPIDLSAMPVPTSALSVIKQIRHQNQGHEAYFLGEFGTQGWPTYFPVAFGLKTPVGLLVLLALAAARFRPRDALEWITLACLALLWIMLVRNKVNIGVRYALLTYPLVAPWLARLFEPAALRDRVWGPLTIAATLWFAGASWVGGTRCLSYFNEIGGGPSRGWLYLADSNVDWGQDFDALAGALKRLGIAEVTTDISSERRLAVPGLYALANPSKVYQVPAITPPDRRLYDSDGGYLPVYTRYVAVSVSRLLGLYSQNDMSWLRTRKLVARVNDSVFLFDMDAPADRPLAP